MAPGWKAVRAQPVVYGSAIPPAEPQRLREDEAMERWRESNEFRAASSFSEPQKGHVVLFVFIYLLRFCSCIHCNCTTAEMPGLCGAAETSEVVTVRETASTLGRPFDLI